VGMLKAPRNTSELFFCRKTLNLAACSLPTTAASQLNATDKQPPIRANALGNEPCKSAIYNVQFTIWGPLKTSGPPQIGSCGENIRRAFAGRESSTNWRLWGRILSECWTLVQHIIKVYHHESGTKVPPYDINKLPFIEFLEMPHLQFSNRTSA